MIEDDATVEKLAREICLTHGHSHIDPDRLVTFMVPEMVNTPRGVAYLTPREEYLAPLWMAFADVARLAIRQANAALAAEAEKGEAA